MQLSNIYLCLRYDRGGTAANINVAVLLYHLINPSTHLNPAAMAPNAVARVYLSSSPPTACIPNKYAVVHAVAIASSHTATSRVYPEGRQRPLEGDTDVLLHHTTSSYATAPADAMVVLSEGKKQKANNKPTVTQVQHPALLQPQIT